MAEYIAREAIRQILYDADAVGLKGLRLINQYPAANVKPVVRGEWIKKHNDVCYWTVCSVCGWKPRAADEFGNVWKSPYCPNCGADCRGGSDE